MASMQSTPEQQRVRVCRALDIKRKVDNFRSISTVVGATWHLRVHVPARHEACLGTSLLLVEQLHSPDPCAVLCNVLSQFISLACKGNGTQ